MILTLTINKQPTPKQSMRIANGHGFTPQRTRDYQASVASQILNQLPEDFQLIEDPIVMEIIHKYPYTIAGKQLLKKLGRKDLSDEPLLVKKTRPDVTDNLNKGIVDAMIGILFVDDALIWKFTACKVFGAVPQSIIRIQTTQFPIVRREDLTNFTAFDMI